MSDTFIPRMEAASPSEQRELLAQAFEALQPGIDAPDWLSSAAKFYAMLDAQAYLSAAEMLVPPGAKLTYQNHGDINGKHMWLVSPNERFVSANTPALALAAASLRANQKDKDNG